MESRKAYRFAGQKHTLYSDAVSRLISISKSVNIWVFKMQVTKLSCESVINIPKTAVRKLISIDNTCLYEKCKKGTSS